WKSDARDLKLEDRTGRRERRPEPASEWDPQPPLPSARLVLVVLLGFVDGDASEIFGNFQQALITVIPLSADFAEEHRSLISPAELQKSNFAGVSAQPAGIFHIIAV